MGDSADWNIDSVLSEFVNVVDSPGPSGNLKDASPVSLPFDGQAHTSLLTPPMSNAGSPSISYDTGPMVSVSTTFYHGSAIDPAPPDLVLVSLDAVYFYVHSQKILSLSTNSLDSLLPESSGTNDPADLPSINIPESSSVLNIILHAVYNLPCAHYSPAFLDVVATVDALPKYGLSAQRLVAPSTPLFQLLHDSYAPILPMGVYCLAGAHDLWDLAVATSPYLLSFSLPTLTDEMAERMGPRYLRRLFFLHLGRADALKRLLLAPPEMHPPSPVCDSAEQKRLTRAWALASAYIAWDARPDMTSPEIQAALTPLSTSLDCAQCKLSLQDRITTLMTQWAIVKNTI